jgi:hypothetical protein
LFFDPAEIRGAYMLTKVRRPAEPKYNKVLRLIARLGGFLGPRVTANPAAKTLLLLQDDSYEYRDGLYSSCAWTLHEQRIFGAHLMLQ